MSVSESACHFFREVLPSANILKQVDYKAEDLVPSSFPGWSNLINRVSATLPSEILYKEREGDGVTGPLTRWRPEPKSFSLMEYLVCKYSNPGALVMDSFQLTLSTAKSFLSLYKQRRFLCYHSDESSGEP